MKKEAREKLYKISEVAEILGVHEDTLRNWEKGGFVVPERIGTRGDRRYTADMIGEIKRKGLVSDLAKKSPANKKDLSEYTKDELIKELQILKKQKKYGLVWENHIEEVVERCKTEAPILVAKKDKQIKDKDRTKPTNILIEGDNYHALQVLNYTHKGKIDVIYIDPPYNTGEEFIYNDKIVDKEDNFKHSKWISFMESRLRLAKKLLKKDGVIFISIDDHEQAQLKILCDGIFGEDNFLSNLTWFKRTKSTNSGKAKKMIQQKIEYIFVYGRQTASDFGGFNMIFAGKKKYPHVGKFGKCRFENIEATDFGRKKRNTMKFSILGIKPRQGRRWQIGRETADKLVKESKIEIIEGIPKVAVYPEDESSESFIPFWSHLEDVGTAESGKLNLSTIIGSDHGFDTVKPKELIAKFLVRLGDDVTILDFMAGSGTTGHAVLALNKKDGGNRKFILCTNNENQICEKVTYERIKRVVKGYTTPKGKKVKGFGGSLEYFKTEFVDVENIDRVSDRKKLEFTYNAGQMIALKEDSFKEVAKNKFYQIFTDEKDKFVGIYFRENLDKLLEMEEKILDKKDVKLYLFSYGVNDFKKDYTEHKNVVVKDIPEPILKIYRRLNS